MNLANQSVFFCREQGTMITTSSEGVLASESWQEPLAGSRVVRIHLLRFLTGCNTRRLNQVWGYQRQRADERLGDLPQRWIQEHLVVRDRNWRPQEDPWQCTASVCSGSALLGDLLGENRSVESDLSVLSIYSRIFLHVFIVYRLLLAILFMLLYSAIRSCVLVALV